MAIVDRQAQRPTLRVPLSRKRYSNPIANRVRRKRQRLPPCLLIENASGPTHLLPGNFCAEAFPIKASDKPEVIQIRGAKPQKVKALLGERSGMAAATEASVSSLGTSEPGVFRDSDIAPRWNEVLRSEER